MGTTIGSLFSGIGGLELGLERAGLGPVVWQCESEPFPRRVLAKHWPGVPLYDDVRTMGIDQEIPYVDLICGGFPCQDLSVANPGGEGLAGARSGLWYEMLRLVGLVRPSWVVVENGYRSWRRWLPFVRRDLWSIGYASVPFRVRADQVGARHERARGFVVAHADVLRPGQPWGRKPGWPGALESAITGVCGAAADAHAIDGNSGGHGAGQMGRQRSRQAELRGSSGDGAESTADVGGERFAAAGEVRGDPAGRGEAATDVAGQGLPIGGEQQGNTRQEQSPAPRGAGTGAEAGHPAQPLLVRGVHVVSRRVDRVKALGNAVVPAVAEVIGRIIVQAGAL